MSAPLPTSVIAEDIEPWQYEDISGTRENRTEGNDANFRTSVTIRRKREFCGLIAWIDQVGVGIAGGVPFPVTQGGPQCCGGGTGGGSGLPPGDVNIIVTGTMVVNEHRIRQLDDDGTQWEEIQTFQDIGSY